MNFFLLISYIYQYSLSVLPRKFSDKKLLIDRTGPLFFYLLDFFNFFFYNLLFLIKIIEQLKEKSIRVLRLMY